MSGHNKFSKIKHKKASSDAKKSKVFSRYSKLITLESKKCNGDINSGSLAKAIDLAKKENVPKDVIEKAIAKGTDANAIALEPVMYEAYGPGGSALVITALTDNKNRIAAEVRHIFAKAGFELASPGSALWAFSKNNEGGFVAQTPLELSEEDMQKMVNLYDHLDENEDIQHVYTNVVGLDEIEEDEN
jgi:YebC/PmpR family DNA-binding regulatory protein